jgi:hypothetical protein
VSDYCRGKAHEDSCAECDKLRALEAKAAKWNAYEAGELTRMPKAFRDILNAGSDTIQALKANARRYAKIKAAVERHQYADLSIFRENAGEFKGHIFFFDNVDPSMFPLANPHGPLLDEAVDQLPEAK